MTARTLSIIIAAGLAVATSAHADFGGDIVDQTLKTLPPLPAGSAPPPSIASAEAPDGVSGPSAPIGPASMPVVVTLGSGDIVDQVLRTLPPATGTAPPPPTAVTPPPVVAPPPSTLAATQPLANGLPAPSPVVAAPTPLAPPSTPPPQAIAPPTTLAPIAAMPAPPATVAAPTPAAPPKPALPASPVAAVTLGSSDIIDQAPPPPPDQPAPAAPVPWHGVYVGGNFGGGWTHGGSGNSCTNSQTGTDSGCDIIANSRLSTSGVFGGGQVGYQRPFDIGLGSQIPLVVGVEADFQGSGISGSQNVSGPFQLVNFPGSCSPCNYTAKQSIDWFGTLRLRLGVPLDDNNVLVYATGGLIYGGVTASQNLAFLGGSTQGNVVNQKSTLSGPTVGAGVEFHISGPWSAKLEGLYYDLGNLGTVALPVGGAPANFSDSKTFGFRGGMIRLGINYKLGEPGAAE